MFQKSLLTFWLFAGSVLSVIAQGQWQGKFEQLGPLLPTPNSYRASSGAPGSEYWQQRADYEIDVEVDENTHLLTGSETITYYNNSPESLKYLWVQLDQNIFADEGIAQTTDTGTVPDTVDAFSFEGVAGAKINDYKGGYKIKSVKATDGRKLPYIINNTMMRIDLPSPLVTGSAFKFSIDWSYTEYDRQVMNGRGGYEYFPEDGNYVYTFAQWFPRMCVFDDYEGWQNKQFLGRGEFALTFGNYKVKITVPADHIVGATGELKNPEKVLTTEQQRRFAEAKKSFNKPVLIVTEKEAREKEKTRSTQKSTWEFHAENVRDFAFAHSRKFIWDAMAVKIGDKTPLAQSLYPKEGNPLWEKHSTLAVKNTLEVYSQRTIDYPYPVAYSVHAADQGMEYPMICFNFGRPNKDGTYSEQTLMGMLNVIVHEVGHNFFPMIVNSDERQWSWMDEGLNSFLDKEVMQERYPELNYIYGTPQTIAPYMRGDKSQMRPIMAMSDNIRGSEFGPNAYYKPSAALTLLRETVMGKELFDKAFKEYAQRWAFKHPKPADFFRTMEDASAVDLDWFWRGWFYSTDHVDVALSDVKWYRFDVPEADPEKKKLKVKKGDLAKNQSNSVFSNGPAPLTITDTQEKAYGEFLSRASDQQIKEKLRGKNIYELTFTNVGGLVSPIIVQWTYADGSKEIEKIPAEIWRYNESEVKKVFVKEKEVTEIVVDPNAKLADVNTTNNVYPAQVGSAFDKFKKGNQK